MDQQIASEDAAMQAMGAHFDIRRRDHRLQECIGHCSGCANLCQDTVAHCLDLGGAHAAREHIVLLLDCADICRTSANFMLRGSALHTQVCGVCAEVCERCAADCERIGPDDEVMRHCAEVCRRCAESCRAMAA